VLSGSDVCCQVVLCVVRYFCVLSGSVCVLSCSVVCCQVVLCVFS